MNVVILHYHLNRGGVTRVIESHLRALARVTPTQLHIAVWHGGRDTGWNANVVKELQHTYGDRIAVSVAALPQLDYDEARESAEAKSDLAAALRTRLHSRFPPDNTILHVHNHNLGRNHQLSAALQLAAADGYRVLLHVHDFAEDLRPDNYRHLVKHANSLEAVQSAMYPLADHIHYATLNRRDEMILSAAGIPSDRLQRLPNAVVELNSNDVTDTADQAVRAAARATLCQRGLAAAARYVLYPVRPIRRKNVSELLLWSILSNNTMFGVSLRPLNSREADDYQAWQSLAAELQCPILFETSRDLTLEENYAAADQVITTSVAEGFGLVFLEASLVGKSIVGRDLPGITDDFYAAGLQFPGLVDRIAIPASAVDFDRLLTTHQQFVSGLHMAFGLSAVDMESLRSQIAELFSAETIDFARLDRQSRCDVLVRARHDALFRDQLRTLNPIFQHNTETAADCDRVMDSNQATIREAYSLQSIGEKLLVIYQALFQKSVGPLVCDASIGRGVVQAFVQPERVFPCRLE